MLVILLVRLLRSSEILNSKLNYGQRNKILYPVVGNSSYSFPL